MNFKCIKCGLGPCKLSISMTDGDSLNVPLTGCPLGGESEFMLEDDSLAAIRKRLTEEG